MSNFNIDLENEEIENFQYQTDDPLLNYVTNNAEESNNNKELDELEGEDAEIMRHDTIHDQNIDPNKFRLEQLQFITDGNESLSLIESIMIGFCQNTYNSTNMKNSLLLKNLCEHLTTSQHYFEMITMISNKAMSNNLTDSKIPTALKTKFIQLTQNFKDKPKKLEEELDDFLNTKGINIFIDEIKLGNMIGGYQQCDVEYAEVFSDIFESKIILFDEQFVFLKEFGIDQKETIYLIDNGDSNYEALLPRVNKQQKGKELVEDQLNGLTLLFHNVLQECDQMSHQVIIEYSDYVENLKEFIASICKMIDKQSIDNLINFSSDDDSIPVNKCISKMKHLNKRIEEESNNFDKHYSQIFKNLREVEISKEHLWTKEKIKTILFEIQSTEIQTKMKTAMYIGNIFETVKEYKSQLKRN